MNTNAPSPYVLSDWKGVLVLAYFQSWLAVSLLSFLSFLKLVRIIIILIIIFKAGQQYHYHGHQQICIDNFRILLLTPAAHFKQNLVGGGGVSRVPGFLVSQQLPHLLTRAHYFIGLWCSRPLRTISSGGSGDHSDCKKPVLYWIWHSFCSSCYFMVLAASVYMCMSSYYEGNFMQCTNHHKLLSRTICGSSWIIARVCVWSFKHMHILNSMQCSQSTHAPESCFPPQSRNCWLFFRWTQSW